MSEDKLNQTLKKHAEWVKKHNEKIEKKLSKKWTEFLNSKMTYVKDSLITVEQANKAFTEWLTWRSRYCYKCTRYPCYDCFFKTELKKLHESPV
jgi:hypothetical protein